jgi:hypothetical protein
MIVWSLIVLKSGFRFWTILLLRDLALDASDWVLVGAILRIALGWVHHVYVIGFDGRVPISTTPNLRVVFSGIPIRSFFR